jgi:hypothetical protein
MDCGCGCGRIASLRDNVIVTGAQMPMPFAVFWAVLEACFLAYFGWRLHVLQRLTPPPPPLMPPRMLFLRIFDHLIRSRVHIKDFLCGWFMALDRRERDKIKTGNLIEFFAWVFYSRSVEQLTPQQDDEINWMLKTMRTRGDASFDEGYTAGLRCIKLSLDPLRCLHRPLLFYACIAAFQQLATVLLSVWGFRRHTSRGVSYWYLQPEAAKKQDVGSAEDSILAAGQSKNGHQAKHSTERAPLLFFHGIGIGLLPYLPLLAQMLHRGQGAVLIEIPAISMSMVEHNPQMHHVVAAVDNIVSLHGIRCFGSVVGHSFGTICVAWIVRLRPQVISARNIRSYVHSYYLIHSYLHATAIFTY